MGPVQMCGLQARYVTSELCELLLAPGAFPLPAPNTHLI